MAQSYLCWTEMIDKKELPLANCSERNHWHCRNPQKLASHLESFPVLWKPAGQLEGLNRTKAQKKPISACPRSMNILT